MFDIYRFLQQCKFGDEETDEEISEASSDDKEDDDDFDIFDAKPKKKLPRSKMVQKPLPNPVSILSGSEDNEEVAATRALIEKLSPMKSKTEIQKSTKSKVVKGKQQTKLSFSSTKTSNLVSAEENADSMVSTTLQTQI